MVGKKISGNQEDDITLNVSYSDDVTRLDYYLSDRLSSIFIFHETAYHTFIRQILAANYGETLDGNHLIVRFIDPTYYSEMEGNTLLSSAIVKLDGQDVIYTHHTTSEGSSIKQWFSIKTRMPIQYESEFGQGDSYSYLSYKLSSLIDYYSFDEDTFDAEAIQ